MFYSTVFDARLIVYQILVLQCIHYLTISTWLLLFHIVFATDLHLALLFNPSYMAMSAVRTIFPAITSQLLSTPIISFALLVVVGRAKKCLDYVATIHILHIVLSALMYGWHWNIEYVAVTGACVLVTTLLGEYLCMQREMQAISRPSATEMTTTTKSSSAATAKPVSSSSNGTSSNGNGTNAMKNDPTLVRQESMPADGEEDDLELGNAKLRVARPLLVSV